MNILIIGLSLSKLGSRSPALKNLDSWTKTMGINHYSFVNLYKYFEIDEADSNMELIKSIVGDYDRIICLGEVASKALMSIDIDHFKLPHPSPRNRVLNNKKYIADELNSCKQYLIRG